MMASPAGAYLNGADLKVDGGWELVSLPGRRQGQICETFADPFSSPAPETSKPVLSSVRLPNAHAYLEIGFLSPKARFTKCHA